MNILIIPVENHDLQLAETETDLDWHSAVKRGLREFLQVHLIERKIAVIFEEQSPEKLTIARQLASQNDSALPWQSINMTDDERRAAGIFDELRKRPYRHVWEDGPTPTLILDRIPADAVREEFFVNQIIQVNDSDREVLVLLGNEHVTPVAEKLRAKGHSVDIQHFEGWAF
jgi:hypothetical protein